MELSSPSMGRVPGHFAGMLVLVLLSLSSGAYAARLQPVEKEEEYGTTQNTLTGTWAGECRQTAHYSTGGGAPVCLPEGETVVFSYLARFTKRGGAEVTLGGSPRPFFVAASNPIVGSYKLTPGGTSSSVQLSLRDGSSAGFLATTYRTGREGKNWQLVAESLIDGVSGKMLTSLPEEAAMELTCGSVVYSRRCIATKIQ